MKTVEFMSFMLIFIGVFNFCCVHSFGTESEFEDDQGPVSTVINKCDPDSFNSKEEVENFNKAFGHVEIEGEKVWALNFSLNFDSSLNGSKTRCKIQTVEIRLHSTSTSEKEKKVTRAHAEFFDHGFFSYKPKFYINPENYCVKKMSRDILTIEICEAASTLNSNSVSNLTGSDFPPTIEKCCPMSMFLTIGENQIATCEYFDDPPWKPRKFMENLEIYPNYKYSRPCDSYFYILPHQLAPQIKREENSPIKFKDVRVLEDGGVETRDSGNHQWKELERNTYCIDGFRDQPMGEKATEEIPTDSFMVHQCVSKISESSKIKDIIYTATSFISSFVLLIIVIVYALIWKQQNIHGWTSGAFSLSMFLWLFCTGVRILYQKDDVFCVLLAVSTHFFRISVYSWMFLLNFDLWSTVSLMTELSQRSKGRTRFFWYCCVALTIPTIVVSISIIIETQFSVFDDSVIRPQYGRERCYLDHTAVKAYAIYPSLILFLPNLLFILLTLRILLNLRNGRKRLNKENSRVNAAQSNNNTEMKLCLKLFVIMGVSWIFEIISGLMDTDEVSWYWMITDIYNIAQPFLLFWVFVCKKTIRDHLSKNYNIFKVGFKWMDVHLPGCFSASNAAIGSDPSESQSQRQATQSSSLARTSLEEKSKSVRSKLLEAPPAEIPPTLYTI